MAEGITSILGNAGVSDGSSSLLARFGTVTIAGCCLLGGSLSGDDPDSPVLKTATTQMVHTSAARSAVKGCCKKPRRLLRIIAVFIVG